MKKAFGIVLLVLAAWILLQGNLEFLLLDGKIWPLPSIAFFAYKSIESILRRHLTCYSFYRVISAHHCKLRL